MIKILNSSMQLQNIIDNYISLKWTERYYSNGSFEIKLPFSIDFLELLQLDKIVLFEDKAGIVESITVDMDNGEVLTVYGRDLTAILDRRIIWNTINFDGKAEKFFYQAVDENCITTATNRVVPNLRNETLKGYTETIKKQVSYQNILQCFEELSEELGMGFKIKYQNGKMIFEVYKGTDRSVHQSIVAPSIFSTDFENVLEQSYSKSVSDSCNTALILSEGEGTERYRQTIENGQGLSRRELYVDAKDLQKGTLADAEYNAQLLQRGKEKLAEYPEVETLDTTINILTNMVYGLGDIVTVVNPRLNLALDTRITEIETIVENSGKSINLTFGNNIPNVYKKLKKKG